MKGCQAVTCLWRDVFFSFFSFFFCVQAFCLHACLCTTYRPGACRGQRRPSHCLELRSQTVVRHHVGTKRSRVKEVENIEGEFWGVLTGRTQPGK